MRSSMNQRHPTCTSGVNFIVEGALLALEFGSHERQEQSHVRCSITHIETMNNEQIMTTGVILEC